MPPIIPDILASYYEISNQGAKKTTSNPDWLKKADNPDWLMEGVSRSWEVQ
jgi:hypothetical protein